MRPAPIFASALASALCLVAAGAAADIYEPNNVQVPPKGLLVPIDSSPKNGETQLYTLFQNRGEPYTSQASVVAAAQITPNAFSPLCGFTATFVMNQAGSKFGLAWYNDTGVPPQASDLHEIVPAGAPLGQMISGATIRNDPAYTGGLVGFALEVGGGEAGHFTNPAYDTLCSSTSVCNPAAHWITAIMFPSTVTANAYYICFEDGNTASNGWNNDGDFNDDVFFLTGLTCAGGGQPCDTGQPGVCAQGVTQCTANGTTCTQVTQPGTETCNGLDDNCDGMVDNGAVCPAGEVCDKGMCVTSCSNGEFVCPPNLACSSDGHCVDPACVSVSCPAGQVCVAGACKGPCDGVTCPYPQVCRAGVCVDPCANVNCPSGQVCQNGACVESCSCLPCATGMACDTGSGQCVDPTCVGKTCGAGTHCVSGSCVDDCMGATCPTGQTCMGGTCVASMSSSSSSSSSGVMFGNGGSATSSGGMDGGTGGSSGSGGAGGTGPLGKKSGCGCRVPGDAEDDGSGAGLLAVAGLAVAVAAGRRRRRG
jgi:uncharacterized membrane protein YgcG